MTRGGSDVMPRSTAPMDLEQMTGLENLADITSSDNPQEAYDRLRDLWGPVAAVDIEPGVPAWLVLGHAEVTQVMRSPITYARDPRKWRWNYDQLLPPGTAIATYCPAEPRPSCFHHDGATHARLKTPLEDALAALPEWQVSARTRQMCQRVIDDMGAGGHTDLVRAYCQPIGFLVMAGLMGFDHPTGAQLMADAATVVTGNGPEVAAAQQRVAVTVLSHIQQRRDEGQHDLITHLAHHPNFDNDLEIASTAIVPMHAAATFLTAWVTQILHLMLSDRGLAGRLRGGRIVLEDALDEVLWRESPLANSPALRFPTKDVELGGRRLRQGDGIVLSIAAANTDPAVHTDDPWDNIGNRAHLSFGTGGNPHACPAPRQARIIARIVVEQLMQHLDLRLDEPGEGLPWTRSPWVRHPHHLPVTYRRVMATSDPTW